MKNLIRKIKNLSRIQMHFVWFYLAAFLLSALVLLSCNFWYKNRMTEYAVRSSQNTLQLHINALDTQLENTSSFLSNFLLMDTDHVTLATTDNADECLNAQLSIQNTFAQQLSLYDNISGLLFYAPWSDVFLMKSNLTEPLSDRNPGLYKRLLSPDSLCGRCTFHPSLVSGFFKRTYLSDLHCFL